MMFSASQLYNPSDGCVASSHQSAKATAASHISLLRPGAPVKPLSVSVPRWISVSVTHVAVAPEASPSWQTASRSQHGAGSSARHVVPPGDGLCGRADRGVARCRGSVIKRDRRRVWAARARFAILAA